MTHDVWLAVSAFERAELERRVRHRGDRGRRIACGGSSSAAPVAPPPAMQASGLSGPLSGPAADPLAKAYQDAQVKLANTNPGPALTYRFAGSPALAERLRQGPPTDDFAAEEYRSSAHPAQPNTRGLDPAVVTGLG